MFNIYLLDELLSLAYLQSLSCVMVQCSFHEMNSISMRARHFLARTDAFRDAGIIMSIPIYNFLVQIKNGIVMMFSVLFSLVLILSAESLAISEQLYRDVSTSK